MKFIPINIPVNPSEWFEMFELVGQGNRANIACMPDLVALFEMGKYRIRKMVMGVGEQTNAFQVVRLSLPINDNSFYLSEPAKTSREEVGIRS